MAYGGKKISGFSYLILPKLTVKDNNKSIVNSRLLSWKEKYLDEASWIFSPHTQNLCEHIRQFLTCLYLHLHLKQLLSYVTSTE